MGSEVYYRPPCEANSFIIRVMKGCPHNKCAFCNMFKDTRCRVLPIEQIIKGMEQDAAELGPDHIRLVDSIYLEGGDPMAIKTDRMLQIMQAGQRIFPALKRYACYATARFTVKKSQEELNALSKAGLRVVYVGLESGSDAILKRTKKGCSTADILASGQKLARASIEMDVSMMIGIGGKEDSQTHAIATARLINAIEPGCVRLRTFIPKTGTEIGADYLAGRFSLLSPHETLRELRLLVENISGNTRLLSEHWSNYVLFNAFMPEAKEPLLAYIDQHLDMPEENFRKPGIDAVRS